MNIKKLKIKANKLFFKIMCKRCSPYYFTKILQREGLDIGSHTIFYDPFSQTIDRQRPWMLHIGDYCKITKGTVILCHDYSRSVLRRAYGEIIGEAKKTIIGDNVFIGMNSIILMGTHIGNNVIVGAGSVVSGNIPDNCVVAGNPARIISSLEEHYLKRKKKCVQEAALYYNEFVYKYSRKPKIEEMGPFFPLFLERKEEAITEHNISFKLNGDDEQSVRDDFLNSTPIFETYDAFCQYASKQSNVL